MAEHKELAKRTSHQRVFCVDGADDPVAYVKKLCPEGAPHPWHTSLVATEPIVTEQVQPGVFTVVVEYVSRESLGRRIDGKSYSELDDGPTT